MPDAKTIVISQPMYFPWVGMLEQIRLADDYVDYVDVAFSKGSFTNRVQIKTAAGPQWLTIPLRDLHLGQPIQDVLMDERQNWRRRHRASLAQAYARTPFVADMLSLVDEVFDTPGDQLAALTLHSMRAVHSYFGFDRPARFHRSSEMGIGNASSERVLAIVRHLGGTRYVTGHGALKYLDHALFDAASISVEYMMYQKLEYPQLFPPFTPFVSVLDLIANMGKDGRSKIVSGTCPWRDLVAPQ
jgi:hypothetical protein